MNGHPAGFYLQRTPPPYRHGQDIRRINGKRTAVTAIHRSTDFAPAMSEAQGGNVASLYSHGMVEHVVDERPDAALEGRAFSQRMGQAIEYELAALSVSRVAELLPQRLANTTASVRSPSQRSFRLPPTACIRRARPPRADRYSLVILACFLVELGATSLPEHDGRACRARVLGVIR